MSFNITTGEISNGEFENVSSQVGCVSVRERDIFLCRARPLLTFASLSYLQAIANGHKAYERRFTGLEAIGKSGMTFLEELIDGALRASDAAVPTVASRRFGAACLTESGKMYAGCNVESRSDPSLNVSALRTTILKAVSDGETKFQGLVISSQVRVCAFTSFT